MTSVLKPLKPVLTVKILKEKYGIDKNEFCDEWDIDEATLEEWMTTRTSLLFTLIGGFFKKRIFEIEEKIGLSENAHRRFVAKPPSFAKPKARKEN